MTQEAPSSPVHLLDTTEGRRIEPKGATEWRRWGPYLSERQWGTVREDYSEYGNAWEYLSHDDSRSRAYRWGEDGIGGFSDMRLRWCSAVALWNGEDTILKERLFGLTNSQGNHGEDVKELYYYTDGIPSHAYMRMLYKYPQKSFPYQRLIDENAKRGVDKTEFELFDTGIFDEHRYFDINIEYAKGSETDILMRLTVTNRGPDAAPLHVLPHLWARNTWSWSNDGEKPSLRLLDAGTVEAVHPKMAPRTWHVDGGAPVLFCENETNAKRLFKLDQTTPAKDAINDYVTLGAKTLSETNTGTKCAAHFQFDLQPGEQRVMRIRFRDADVAGGAFDDFDAVFDQRLRETEEFYGVLQQGIDDPDARLLQRHAIAGMLWSKQFYHFEVKRWLDGDPTQPKPPDSRLHGRDSEWTHLSNSDVVTMPDKWEYPWYASWDLAFHCIVFALVDPEFAKSQLILLTREWYMHPNGQLPAYEWAFGDVNPPVHASATWRVYQMDRALRGIGDRDFLERVFHKLMLNFNWWVNRKDASGRNIFQGGFLGLDNIGIFDRSSPLPTGGCVNQADGTAWMAMYALNLMRIALELSRENHVYEDIASKFFEHFLYIAEAMTRLGGENGLWDDQDNFFYDVLALPGGQNVPLRVRSMVGLIPLYAVEVLEPDIFEEFPGFTARLKWFLHYRPDLASLVSRWTEPAHGELHLLSLLRGHRMKHLLRRALDETEFLSDYGIRALSKVHKDHPYVFEHDGHTFGVGYVPGESTSGVFGGNSNWRGPIWFPVNYLLIESLYKFHRYYHDDFKVECPVGSGKMLTLREVGEELSRRLCRLFLRDATGKRAAMAHHSVFEDDPEFRDNILFYEYFHGDSGLGLGASHQTGWTGIVALLLQPRAAENANTVTHPPRSTAQT